MNYQNEKSIIRNLYDDMSRHPNDLGRVFDDYFADDCVWRGFHPFNEIKGAQQVVTEFWNPLHHSLKSLQRREDIFFAGSNEIDGDDSVWVVSMGHFMGLFDEAFLGIQPTNKMAFMRYCEFNRMKDDRVQETALYFDIPQLMLQAGYQPFPIQTGAHLIQPGPMTHDGLLYDEQPVEDGRATLSAINAMIKDLGQWDLGLSLEDELRRTWHEDMIWWGPTGIGATYTIERYAKQHAGPFRAGLTDRSKTRHIARLAEGHYGGFFGWPNFTARPTGGFMGMPACDQPGEFRVIDIYRRADNKLAENWIFIDLLHFWKCNGLDILKRTIAP